MDFGFKHCYYTILLCSLNTGMFKWKQNAKKSLWADLSLNEERNKFCILLHCNLSRTKQDTPKLAQYNRFCGHRRCTGNAMVPNGLSSQIQLTKIASAWYVRCASGIVLSWNKKKRQLVLRICCILQVPHTNEERENWVQLDIPHSLPVVSFSSNFVCLCSVRCRGSRRRCILSPSSSSGLSTQSSCRNKLITNWIA